MRAQATLASGIGSLESIPELLKCLQIWSQATLDSGIVSLESIPGLLKRLQIRAQATTPWNQFLGSIKMLKYRLCPFYFDTVCFFRFDLAYFWNKPSSLHFDFLICGISILRFASFFWICGIYRLRFPSICSICGINRIRSASIFRNCGINRIRFALSKV